MIPVPLHMCGVATISVVPAAAAIRKAIRQTMGAQAVRELPRCQYEIVMKQVAMWDDYKTMKRIKNKGVVV